jgi:hypothetical protein
MWVEASGTDGTTYSSDRSKTIEYLHSKHTKDEFETKFKKVIASGPTTAPSLPGESPQSRLTDARHCAWWEIGEQQCTLTLRRNCLSGLATKKQAGPRSLTVIVPDEIPLTR